MAGLSRHGAWLRRLLDAGCWLVQEARSLEPQVFTCRSSSRLISVSVRVPGDHGQRRDKNQTTSRAESRLNHHEQVVASGEKGGRQGRDGGQKKIKVPDTASCLCWSISSSSLVMLWFVRVR